MRNIHRGREYPYKLEEADGPFRYEYLTISHVLGAKLPECGADPLEVARFPSVNASAVLTQDWDATFFHIDRANAVSSLLLTGLFGQRRFKRLARYKDRFLRRIFSPEWVFHTNLEAQQKRTRERRRKEHSGSGCCLLYRAEGELNRPLDLKAARCYGDVGVVLNGLDGSVIRDSHKLNVRSVETAVSIAMTDTNGSPQTRFLAQGIVIRGKDQFPIYARELSGSAAGLAVTTFSSDDLLESIETYTHGLSADTKLASAASLFAQSQHKSNDNLRSFIASWSALELLIYNLEKKYRKNFQELLASENVVLPEWDRNLSALQIEDYRLRDRFYAVACTFHLDDAEADLREFGSLNSTRNDYYHRLEIKDTDLPTEAVQALFRKYLKRVLSNSEAGL